MATWLVPRQDLTVEQMRAVEMPPEEHMLFLGGPGSGKTQVLVHRADHLRQLYKTSDSRFHIFVFTNVLKDYIRSALDLLDLPEHCVSTLDAWCCDYYQQHIGRKIPWNSEKKTRDWTAVRLAVLDHLKSSNQNDLPFDFVLVDEGQDLDETCHEILVSMSHHVSVCMDHNQQIYDTGSQLSEVLEVLGLRRRKQAFLETYRCCPYIVDVASQYIDDAQEREQYVRQTRTSTSDIETPVLYLAERFEDERDHLIETVRVRISKGEKIAILLPQRKQVFGFAKGLREAGLPVENPKEMVFSSDAPKIMPYHSAKGLTFDTVLMPRLTAGSFTNVSPARIRRLLFVGLTRATRWVYLSTTEHGFNQLDALRDLGDERRITIRTAGDQPAKDAATPEVNAPPADDALDFL